MAMYDECAYWSIYINYVVTSLINKIEWRVTTNPPFPMKWTTSKFHCHSHSSHLNFAPVLAIREPVLSIRTNMALKLPVLDSLDWQAVTFLALFSQIQISGIELQMVSTCKAFLLLTYGPSPCLLLSPPSLILELMWHSSEVYQRQNSLCGIPHFTELRWSF